jgi:uncharacterized protein (UPF0261 family)
MAVVLIGTLDTKGTEFQFVRDRLRDLGIATTVIDAGVLGPPAFAPEVPRHEVYAAAGTSLAAVVQTRDRGRAVEAAARGVVSVVLRLLGEGQVEGLLGLGGSAGTTIATAAMRAIPFGIPKLMVSTLASGQVKPYVGVRDIMMMYSVVDICGLNRISRNVLANAAGAMAGMVQAGIWRAARREPPGPGRAARRELPGPDTDRPLITASMFGVTTPCVEAARHAVEAQGYEALVFHATGTGGMSMESFIADGLIAGVLDITTTELADELVGGLLSAGSDRLTAAGLRGVPQVISLGALDMVNFGPPETVPERFRGRRFYQHNPTVTLMRTTPEENDQLGKEIAQKASAAKGPTAVVVPLRGVSAIDAEGEAFWWPEADAALFQSLRQWMSPQVELLELDLHVNDPRFAAALADKLLQFMEAGRQAAVR